MAQGWEREKGCKKRQDTCDRKKKNSGLREVEDLDRTISVCWGRILGRMCPSF